ncbi:hypothetical protein IMSHALPRED_005256 [Imshaugia aleurites]|uniref:Uncharacterized protein n=1 Tax=Imshaugia aleurites TaxID=172621 RepID=A0A8H3II39_9LECA|nr:hypothetical protein IMSHALPRED_005256 [Imshaugia aleurites]
MFLLLNLMFQTLAAIIIVQASQSFSETTHQNALKNRFVRSRGLNATTAGSNLTVIDSTTSPHALNTSTNLLQRVHGNLTHDVFVQECDSGNGSPVVQDCSCSVQQLAAQAIEDAITMVKTIMGIWNDKAYSGYLQQYMGTINSEIPSDSCTSPAASAWIDATLSNLAELEEYEWLPSDPNWIKDYSDDLSELSVYCVAGVPPQQNAFVAQCPSTSSEYSPFGWAYTSNETKGYSYFLGFCESVLQQQGFISRAAMLEQLQLGEVKLSDEQIFANYGRAALNLLVQLSPLISSQVAVSGNQVNGYPEVAYVAEVYGCETIFETVDPQFSSLVNPDSWALWITG